MRIVACRDRSGAGKFEAVTAAFPSIWEGSVLDVGCRGREMERCLRVSRLHIRYLGFDLAPPADVVGDLGRGLPFVSRSFTVVVALDVLEHVDDIHAAFGELCRVAGKYVVLTLPNVYEIKSRLRMVLGTAPSGKYGLPVEPPVDRHRWLFSLHEARSFVHRSAERCGFEVREEGYLMGLRRASRGVAWLSRAVSNLWVPWYLACLGRR